MADKRRAVDDPAALTRAAQIMRAALDRRAQRVKEVVDGMPPLTDEQREKLALIIGAAGPPTPELIADLRRLLPEPRDSDDERR